MEQGTNEEEIKVDDNLTKTGNNKKSGKNITVKEFIRKNLISPYVARVFVKTLDKTEYSETVLDKKYNDFLKEKPKEED